MTLPAATAANATHTVTGHGGTRLSVPEFGTADGPPILLIHGWSQCHLSWLRQFTGPLADGFRLIAPDLRGHGQSEKPAEPEAYNTSAPWAGDIAAIVGQLGLNRPLLVGWSMGGKVLMDYLRVHGDAAISGAAYVGTAATSGKHQPASAAAQRSGDPAVAALDMYEADLDANLRATAAFVAACTAQPPAPEVLAWMVGFNMLCPPHVRAAARLRHDDYKPDLGRTSCPSLIIAGAREQIMPMALTDELSGALPQAETLIYDQSGHAPFWEEHDRFNADLARFAAHCHGSAS